MKVREIGMRGQKDEEHRRADQPFGCGDDDLRQCDTHGNRGDHPTTNGDRLPVDDNEEEVRAECEQEQGSERLECGEGQMNEFGHCRGNKQEDGSAERQEPQPERDEAEGDDMDDVSSLYPLAEVVMTADRSTSDGRAPDIDAHGMTDK